MMNPLYDIATIQSMRRQVLATQIIALEQYLKPFDNANYIDCEIMRIRDVIQKAKDW